MAELLASKVVVVEEPPTIRGVPTLSTSSTGAVGLAERGPIGVATLVTSFEEYASVFGGFGDGLDLPLAADWPRRPRQQVDRLAGKPALTRYQVLGHDPASNRSRLALFPETGRTHQLRVHLQALGHAIVGDLLYGDASGAGDAGRLLLHADQLRFIHPASGRLLCVDSPAPF